MTSSANAGFTLQILSGLTDSVAISCRSYEDASALAMYAPSVLPESVKIMVHPRKDAAAGDAGWCDLVDYAGANITAPAAGKAKWFAEIPACAAFKIVAASAVAADRTFFVTKSYTT